MPCLRLRRQIEFLFRNYPSQILIVSECGVMNEKETGKALFSQLRSPAPCLFVHWHTDHLGCEEDAGLDLIRTVFDPMLLARQVAKRNYEVLISRDRQLPGIGSTIEIPRPPAIHAVNHAA